MPVLWSVPREWPGATVFIIAGGPSVAGAPLERLEGKRVIVVNSSYARAPWAPVLFFADARWWRAHECQLKDFPGRLVTGAAESFGPRLLKLRKIAPDNVRGGLCDDPTCVVMRRTSVTGAINLAVHFGAAQIVLLGVDGQPAADGRTHHHAPHSWPQLPTCWAEQRKDLERLVKPLELCGIRVVNASPGSALADLWPVMTLAEALEQTEERVAA